MHERRACHTEWNQRTSPIKVGAYNLSQSFQSLKTQYITKIYLYRENSPNTGVVYVASREKRKHLETLKTKIHQFQGVSSALAPAHVQGAAMSAAITNSDTPRAALLGYTGGTAGFVCARMHKQKGGPPKTGHHPLSYVSPFPFAARHKGPEGERRPFPLPSPVGPLRGRGFYRSRTMQPELNVAEDRKGPRSQESGFQELAQSAITRKWKQTLQGPQCCGQAGRPEGPRGLFFLSLKLYG